MMTPEKLRQRRQERETRIRVVQMPLRHAPRIDLAEYAGKYGGYRPDEPPKPRVENICWILWCLVVGAGVIASLAGWI